MPHGVGIVGAGPGVAALHLPTLARLGDDFEVVHVSDAGSGRAEALAGAPARARRRASRNCSPIRARRGRRRCAARPPSTPGRSSPRSRRASARSSCEKPLATTEADAEAVIDACRAAGTALLVGTNHLFDPAWGRAKHHLLAGGHSVRAISVTLALPPNGRYHDVVTELPAPAAAPRAGGPTSAVPEVAASVVRQLLTGLAVHDLPLLRDLAPGLRAGRLRARGRARSATRSGYRASGMPVRLATVMLPDGADALWQPRDHDRRPSGSRCRSRRRSCTPAAPRCSVRSADGQAHDLSARADDGYVAEWRALADVLNGVEVGRVRRAARRCPLRARAGGCRVCADPRGSAAMTDVPVAPRRAPTGRRSPNCPLRTRLVDRPRRCDRRRRRRDAGWVRRRARRRGSRGGSPSWSPSPRSRRRPTLAPARARRCGISDRSSNARSCDRMRRAMPSPADRRTRMRRRPGCSSPTACAARPRLPPRRCVTRSAGCACSPGGDLDARAPPTAGSACCETRGGIAGDAARSSPTARPGGGSLRVRRRSARCSPRSRSTAARAARDAPRPSRGRLTAPRAVRVVRSASRCAVRSTRWTGEPRATTSPSSPPTPRSSSGSPRRRPAIDAG